MTKNTLPTWNLDDLLKVDDFDALYDDLKNRIQQFDTYYSTLQPDMPTQEFTSYIEFSKAFVEDMSRLGALPELMESVDTKSAIARKLSSRARDLEVEASAAARKINQWLKGKEVEGKPKLDDKNADRLFAVLGDLEYVYKFSRKNAGYTLGEKEENIISIKDSVGMSTLLDLRGIIATEQRYEADPDDGKGVRIFETSSELLTFTRSTSPKARENVYRALYAEQAKNLDKYNLIYQSIAKDWSQEAKLRGYKSPIAMRNVANHVPDEAIEVLLRVCEDNKGVFQDFFKTKAKLMGVDRLRRFDIYASIGEAEAKFSYPQALKLVDEVFSSFSETFVAHARKVVAADHIDARLHANKNGGAFCATIIPRLEPYVFLNFTGEARDVSTLAHELGHAVHALYASDKSHGAQHANLPLAETASTFGEMLLFEHLLAQTDDKREQLVMLIDKMADSFASILRQTYFTKFEIEAHAKLKDGLTADDLGKLWLKTLEDQFGDSVEVDPVFAMEWSYIPHIVNSPFYCYAYSFGDLLSLALFARYRKEGQSFVPKIEAILRAGGSRDPQEVLQEVGIDMTDATFWQGSFEILKGWQHQLEELA